MNKLALFGISAALAACGGSVDVGDLARAAATPVRAEWKNGRLDVDVPVPVVTIGLPEATVGALRTALTPHTVNHQTGDINQSLPPDYAEVLAKQDPTVLLPGFGESIALPIVPTAHFKVTAAPRALEQKLAGALAQARLDGNLYDAVRVEDFLAAALPAHGFPLNENAPTVVVLHLAALGTQGHGWKHQGHTGHLAPVRTFGERHPMLVLDPSAVADSWASGHPYNSPLASGDATNMAAFVRDATEFRILQGPVMPPSQAPCHAVTALLGVRHDTSLSEQMLRKVEDTFDYARVKGGWDRLTGTNVFFDFKVLSLPVDDPVLDLLARGEFPAFEVMRGYLSLMFEQYHVEHAGCEEYLTVTFAGDVATVPGASVLGIGTYDDSPGHRIAMGWVHELFRFTFDPESPLYLLPVGEGKDYLNWWEYIISHETGHIFGMPHPFHISPADTQPTDVLPPENQSFSSIWSSMSYQQDGRVIDFGRVDANNWRRNRAAFALGLAASDGREGSAQWQAAMARAGALDWQGVWEALRR